jgi:thiosulfate reductase cytochrome b subunit
VAAACAARRPVARRAALRVSWRGASCRVVPVRIDADAIRSVHHANPSRHRPRGGPRPARPIHPLWVRVSHWLNALAAILMVLSGWRIYDASPIYPPFVFAHGITLGGWLGGALQWHFAAMWLLVGNGLFYLTMSISTGRVARKMLPVTPRAVWRDLGAALRGRLAHDDPSVYNAVQRAAYLFAIADLSLLVLSGLTIWKSVQFPLLRASFGGYDNARIVHFWAMTLLVAFVVVHVAMALRVPRSLLAMLRGR